jgi:2-dehydropantoate 2-reductase
MLARAGASVTLIGRPYRIEVMARDGLWLETRHFQQRVSVGTSTSVDAACDAAFVLLCVKTFDTEQAAKSLAGHLAPGAVVVSLQNGVDNVGRIRDAAGFEAIPAVVYVGVAMTGPGRVKHSGRGDLIVGDPWGTYGDQVQQVAQLFTRAGVSCVVSDNIKGELWTKLIMNCAFNAVSASGRARYGTIVHHPLAREILRQIVQETVAVGVASGVRFPDTDLLESVFQLGMAMSEATSSTAQDLARGKATEIDSLNGYVVRRGAEIGVATPVNQTLHALVKLLESAG